MTTRKLRWAAAAVFLGLASATLAARAEDGAMDASKPKVGSDGSRLGAGAASLPPIVDPGNGGVAGTGMGKMPPGDITGRGLSVKGPPGQGISDSVGTTP